MFFNLWYTCNMKQILRKIIIFTIFAICTPCIVSAANFSISERVDSYNSVTKELLITVNIKAEKTDIYQLEMFFASTSKELTDQPNRGFTYRQNPLAAGKTDTQQFKISNVPSGEFYFYYVDNNGEKTPEKKIVLASNFLQTLDSDKLDLVKNNPDIYFYFPNTAEHVKYSDTQVELNGIIKKISDSVGDVRFNVYLGTSKSNFFASKSFDFTDTLKKETESSWSAVFTELKPGTTYYILVKDDTNKNNQTNQIGSIYSFTTSLSKESEQTKEVSLVETDNTGEGGIFSYSYPTNTTDPGSLDYNLSTSDGSLVPCRADGDITTRCGFKDLMKLVANIVNFCLILILPIIAIIAAVTGVQMIMNRRNPIELSKYKERATRILIGIGVILLAWTLIATVLTTVLGDEARKYVLLDLTSLK